MRMSDQAGVHRAGIDGVDIRHYTNVPPVELVYFLGSADGLVMRRCGKKHPG